MLGCSIPIAASAAIASALRALCRAGQQRECSQSWPVRSLWNVPINLIVSHVYNFGEQPVQLSVGGRVFADSPGEGPDWGLRGVVTFLFPTGG